MYWLKYYYLLMVILCKTVKCNVTTDMDALWSKRKIFYQFDDSLDESKRSHLISLFNKFHAKTCLRFVARKHEEQDYVHIQLGSWKTLLPVLGRRGGRQTITFTEKDFDSSRIRVILRDLMRTVGFYYEMQRPDRDLFVSVNKSNIAVKYWSLFSMPDQWRINLLDEGYDFNSVMQFEPAEYTSISVNASAAFSTVSRLDVVGQENGLSETDIRRINKAYKCLPLIRYINRKCPENWISGIDGQCYYFSFSDPTRKIADGLTSRKACERMLGIPLVLSELTLPIWGFVLDQMRRARVDDVWTAASHSSRELLLNDHDNRCAVMDVVGNTNAMDNGLPCEAARRHFICQQTAANECLYVRNDTFTVYPDCVDASRMKFSDMQILT
ncbi:zinc metalloproteinase nas-14-like isoform X2 [Paramacrobiotus metropolitanus]|uniref:zinc metalloproteinase nas-14-like isoform X2 n=1 Tax=Paramacrobiotus metropolitanus TaxID=2943436 RepID=UPI00244620E7|nr:zinc metalloproteinase nas-14-like isoform X2 [Paramacrobiotus metropolitanus]